MTDYFAEYGRNKETRGRLSSPTWRRTFLFAAQSIRVRLGRCVITAASVVCAIAFLTYNVLALESFVRGRTATPQAQGATATEFFAGLEQFTAEKSAEQKMIFVTALSVLVCFAGITNSMMMSIKERYREIATLKCLGAVNGYVTRLFLVEAALQGGLGSAVGLALGLVLFWVGHGAAASAVYVMQACAVCFAAGVAMTLLASVWPIRVALAMMPIEALRVVE